MDVVEQIRAVLDRATQDFDGRDEIMRRAADEIDRLRSAPTVAAQQCGRDWRDEIPVAVPIEDHEIEGYLAARALTALEARFAEIDAHRRKILEENERLLHAFIEKDRELATLRDRIKREPVVKPVALAHVRLEDDGLFADLEVLDGSRMQVSDSPVPLYLASAPERVECATEGCGNRATNEFVRGSIGSTYCGECFVKVIDVCDASPPASREATP